MEYNQRTVVLLVSLLLLLGLLLSFLVPVSFDQNDRFQALADYLYESPILKSYRPLFSVGGKKIVNLNDEQKQNETSPNLALNDSANKSSPVASAVPSPTPLAQAKQKVDPKIKGGAPSAPGLTVTLDPNGGKNKDDDWTKDEDDLAPTIGGNGGAAVINPEPNLNQEILEWKFKLSQNPSKELMTVFVQQYLSGKVRKAVFYGVIRSLLDSNDESSQRISIYGLASTPSYDSYDILASHTNDPLLKLTNVNFIHKVLQYYNQVSQIQIVISALHSSNEVVVMAALENISEMNLNSRSVNNNGRNVRGGGGTITSSSGVEPSVLQSLANQLRELSQSNVAHIAQNSEQLLQSLSLISNTNNPSRDGLHLRDGLNNSDGMNSREGFNSRSDRVVNF